MEENKETIDSVGKKTDALKEQVESKGRELNELSDRLFKLMEPKLMKAGKINGKPVNIMLTKQGDIIIKFGIEGEGEKFYNEVKN